MRRASRLIAAALVSVLAFGIAGCSETTAANTAIEAANAESVTYTELDAQIRDRMNAAGGIQFTAEGVVAGLDALDEAAALLNQRKTVIATMRAEFAKIPEMKVADEVQEYARKQIAITDLLATMDDLSLELVATTRELYELIRNASTDEERAAELSTRLDELALELEKVDAQITTAEKDADAYFVEKGLGGS